MQRNFIFAQGEYYHIYDRGVEKRKIFLDEADRKRFQRLLYVGNGERAFVFRDTERKTFAEIDRGETLVAIGAYVLMPNHFHILIKETREGGISAFMEKLLTGYVSYFNKRNQRVGPLFQSTFQARHVSQDEHLKYLFAYIHLNPVTLKDAKWQENGIKNKTDARRFLEKYRYSSYLDHSGAQREESAILTQKRFPEYFSQPQEFQDFLDDWLSFRDEGGGDEFEHTT